MYSIKAAGSDKKLYKDIDAELESQYDSLVRLSASLSPPAGNGDGESSKQNGRTKKRSKDRQLPTIDLSRASPFGPLSQVSARRLFAYLIATLNASHPDYDFSHILRPSDFKREPSLRRIMHTIDSRLQNLRPHPKTAYLEAPVLSNSAPVANSYGNEIWSPCMWNRIDNEMNLRYCDKFSYVPDVDPFDGDVGSIWSMHYFFFNRTRKRVCYIYLRGLSVISHSPMNAPVSYSKADLEAIKAAKLAVGDGAGKRASYWFACDSPIEHGETYGGADDDDDETMVIDDPGDDEIEVPHIDLDEIRSDLAEGYFNYDAEEYGFDPDEYGYAGDDFWVDRAPHVRGVSEEIGDAMEM